MYVFPSLGSPPQPQAQDFIVFFISKLHNLKVLIGYEFDEGNNTPPHKCDALDTVKISNTRTNLICIVCKKIVGCWDDISKETKKIYPEASHFSEATLKSYT